MTLLAFRCYELGNNSRGAGKKTMQAMYDLSFFHFLL